MSIINKKKQRKQIKNNITVQEKPHIACREVLLLLTLGKQKGIIKSENKTLYSGGENGIHR